MIDEVTIFCKAGNGGNGCRSFYRDKFTRCGKFGKGIPDGGDGGRGGDIILKVDGSLTDLSKFHHKQHFYAQNGFNGSSKKKKGKDAQNLIVSVPAGTVVYDAEKKFILRDLNEKNQELNVVKGGCPGLGNFHHKEATAGQKGASSWVVLELKLMADVGIVGLPNAGKSTLICAVSGAHSRIAGYPFTTKSPVLGTVKWKDFEFTIADIPGLIEGSHKGRGLGDRFLRHIERTKIIMLVIDMAATFGQNPLNDYFILNRELERYSKQLALKDKLLVANKMDLEQSKLNLKTFKKKIKSKIYPISALERIGMEELIEEICKKL